MYKVMVVDDDRFQCLAAARVIEKFIDSDISMANDGVEAISLLDEDSTFDLIFCDLNMPNIDGVELIKEIAERNLDVSIVLMSAVDVDILSAVKEMANVYGIHNVKQFSKPLNEDKVAQTLYHLRKNKSTTNIVSQQAFTPTEDDIRQALEANELKGFLQPHVDGITGAPIGAEILIRWLHPQHGLLLPGLFLDKLVTPEIKYAITKKMLSIGITYCSRSLEKGQKLQISVNVEISDVLQPDFVDMITQLIQKANIPAHLITLEITEREFTNNLGSLLNVMSRLRLRDIGISIDDFGTGHSSLVQLINGPFTQLKIDRCFVRNMLSSHKHFVAVEASLMLAQKLGLEAVAEGVETKEQAIILKSLGCNTMQGYLYSPALNHNDFTNWLETYTKINLGEVT